MNTDDKKFIKLAREIQDHLEEAMPKFKKAAKYEDAMRIQFAEGASPLAGTNTMIEAWEEVFKAVTSVKVALDLLIEYTKNGKHTEVE